MRWILIALALSAFTPITDDHDTPEKVNAEVTNIENSLQDQQHTVFQSTPILSQVKDGGVVIVSSATYNKLMWRLGQEIYAVNGSCVTVYR